MDLKQQRQMASMVGMQEQEYAPKGFSWPAEKWRATKGTEVNSVPFNFAVRTKSLGMAT